MNEEYTITVMKDIRIIVVDLPTNRNPYRAQVYDGSILKHVVWRASKTNVLENATRWVEEHYEVVDKEEEE